MNSPDPHDSKGTDPATRLWLWLAGLVIAALVIYAAVELVARDDSEDTAPGEVQSSFSEPAGASPGADRPVVGGAVQPGLEEYRDGCPDSNLAEDAGRLPTSLPLPAFASCRAHSHP